MSFSESCYSRLKGHTAAFKFMRLIHLRAKTSFFYFDRHCWFPPCGWCSLNRRAVWYINIRRVWFIILETSIYSPIEVKSYSPYSNCNRCRHIKQDRHRPVFIRQSEWLPSRHKLQKLNYSSTPSCSCSYFIHFFLHTSQTFFIRLLSLPARFF